MESLSVIQKEPIVTEITGLQLWQDLSGETVSALKQLWRQCGLLLIRRQALSERDLVRFSNYFGQPEIIVREDWQSDLEPAVIRISNMKDGRGRSIGGLGAGELGWHTDQSYVAEPATGSVLYMVEMPATAPATYWLSLREAYVRMPFELKRAIAGRWAVHDYLKRQSTYDDEAPMHQELRRKTPLVRHKLVQTDPLTGEELLYFDPSTAVGIADMDETEGRELLAKLTETVLSVSTPYQHHWQIGDVVMWDNGMMWHRRDAFADDGCRLLKRTTLQLPPDQHPVPRGIIVNEVS